MRIYQNKVLVLFTLKKSTLARYYQKEIDRLCEVVNADMEVAERDNNVISNKFRTLSAMVEILNKLPRTKIFMIRDGFFRSIALDSDSDPRVLYFNSTLKQLGINTEDHVYYHGISNEIFQNKLLPRKYFLIKPNLQFS